MYFSWPGCSARKASNDLETWKKITKRTIIDGYFLIPHHETGKAVSIILPDCVLKKLRPKRFLLMLIIKPQTIIPSAGHGKAGLNTLHAKGLSPWPWNLKHTTSKRKFTHNILLFGTQRSTIKLEYKLYPFWHKFTCNQLCIVGPSWRSMTEREHWVAIIMMQNYTGEGKLS